MLEEERKKFVNQISDEIKAAIVKAAEGVQKKNQIKIDNERAAEARRRIEQQRIEAAKAAGTYEDPKRPGEDDAGGWAKDTKREDAQKARQEYENYQSERQNRPPKAQPEDTGFARGAFTRSSAPAGGGPPRRGQEEERKGGPGDAAGFAKGGPPTFTRGNNSRKDTAASGQDSARQTEDGPSFGGFRNSNAPRGNRGRGDGGNRGGSRGGGGGFDRGDRSAREGGERGGFGRSDRGARGGRDNAGGGGGELGGFRKGNNARK